MEPPQVLTAELADNVITSRNHLGLKVADIAGLDARYSAGAQRSKVAAGEWWTPAGGGVSYRSDFDSLFTRPGYDSRG